MIGIIPAAGVGARIQPLGCSKELLPVGSRQVDGIERPKAVSEYLVERMVAAGASQICFVISAEKTDIVKYYSERDCGAEIFYVVQPHPRGLCDAIFRAGTFARTHDTVLIGLPDTIWFPEDAYLPALNLQESSCNLVLFPVEDPTVFDSVDCNEDGAVREVHVKKKDATSRWIWGAVTAHGESLHHLRLLWEARRCSDEYLGDLLNAFIAEGNVVRGKYSGSSYLDVGTLEGYRSAQDYLRANDLRANALRANDLRGNDLQANETIGEAA
ncbi:MAG TPA: sugar phosphate nucleotidyltransferase [Candidatus Angelobacter sp.]|nr:sugar phosphate nucleotidyltransferase [Candidatus Angelobacter sp.]